MVHTYRPRGVCSQLMRVEIENGIVKQVEVKGGCDGNLQGISRLIVGMDAKEAISRMEGIRCGFKATSCPDQLSKALRECLEKEAN
ncbi:MAG TPA: TIGR03905 family TSCPD domain-containing protein [Candidatus Scatomorpha pullistercoris]|uniref:ribonucleoside-diphosphate reductase n=1 Tax=Candidatus Scatomorpha pullistercoris TaxID=2840929 RepID=A0A9D1G733_9FIRM|nr:TIGR03905 family TSCPD domain-containing protein [Candidatus Scatomorpha pullistercoris]